MDNEAMEAISHLENASNLVRAGWGQGLSIEEMDDGSVSYCMIGALCATMNLAQRMVASSSLELRALYEVTNADNLVRWNDEEGRTLDDVVAAFARAIELVRRLPEE